MELKDAIEMTGSKDYQKRYIGEYWELRIRADKLEAMLEKYKAGTLTFTPSCDYELLFEQLIYMRQYQRILESRAEIEKIIL
ncbi:crAss001_48 related protein [Pectinatus frisingensis]|uniref:crAss001_48 related protein n=1 Tax=Pectinatus frisingensis TaxID=865 RepID=UPI003D8063B7